MLQTFAAPKEGNCAVGSIILAQRVQGRAFGKNNRRKKMQA